MWEGVRVWGVLELKLRYVGILRGDWVVEGLVGDKGFGDMGLLVQGY